MSTTPERKRDSLHEMWEAFRQQTIPNVSDVQRIEMKKAFYAGAAQILLFQLHEMLLEDEDTAVMQLEKLHQEVQDFFSQSGGVWENPFN